MFSRNPRRNRQVVRPRRRPEKVAVEAMETRQLMTYSPFGFSLPQLSVTGYAAPQASYGGALTVNVKVENQGASSLVEPTHLAPGSVSTADAPPTTVQVFAAAKPNATTGAILVNTIAIPAIPQNGDFETISTFALPTVRPAGFPANGGKIYLTLVVNNSQAFIETNTVNNVFRIPTPVKITNPLPDLQVIALDIPGPLQPGEVISPTIRIANFGSGNPAAQGPVTVQLVASVDKNFGPGDAVVGQYTITSLPGISGVPSLNTTFTDANVIPEPNVNTTTIPPLKLPSAPGTYFLGIVIDPFTRIRQTYPPSPPLHDPVQVGPAEAFLPAGTLLVQTNGVVPTFPNLPSSVINPQVVPPVVVVPPLFPNPGGFTLAPGMLPGTIVPVKLNPASAASLHSAALKAHGRKARH